MAGERSRWGEIAQQPVSGVEEAHRGVLSCAHPVALLTIEKQASRLGRALLRQHGNGFLGEAQLHHAVLHQQPQVALTVGHEELSSLQRLVERIIMPGAILIVAELSGLVHGP